MRCINTAVLIGGLALVYSGLLAFVVLASYLNRRGGR